MYEIDLIRGIAYQGGKGYYIKYNKNQMYIINNGDIIYLTNKNCKKLQEICL